MQRSLWSGKHSAQTGKMMASHLIRSIAILGFYLEYILIVMQFEAQFSESSN